MSYPWEDAVKVADAALVRAQKVIDEVAGWSGSSGNWPLQDASANVRRALEALRQAPYPNDCQCHRALDDVKDGVWFGPCEDNRNHKIGCPVAARAEAKQAGLLDAPVSPKEKG